MSVQKIEKMLVEINQADGKPAKAKLATGLMNYLSSSEATELMFSPIGERLMRTAEAKCHEFVDCAAEFLDLVEACQRVLQAVAPRNRG